MDSAEHVSLLGGNRPSRGSNADRPSVLIATTTWWAFPARIAMEFHRAGVLVDVICPREQPILTTRCVNRAYHYSALQPLRRLARVIGVVRPTMVIPCDDRVVGHLHKLHDKHPGSAIAAVIEESLGSASSFPIVSSRTRFIQFARQAGVRAPDMVGIGNADDAERALDRLGLPAVIKADGTWGGLGVEIVHSPRRARQAARRIRQPLDASKAIKRLFVDRDPYHLLAWLRRETPRIGIQAFVGGTPANCIAACWKGRMLALLRVEVVATGSALGAATVVRVTDNAEMAFAAERLVAGLGLSGFCGFDFMLDETTGHAELIEINPRSTPLCHLALTDGRAPVAAMAAKLSGRSDGCPAHAVDARTIAYFPQAWHADPGQDALRSGMHDVPWNEPALLRALLRTPRPDRGALAVLVRRVRRLARGGLFLPVAAGSAECEPPRLAWPITQGEGGAHG